MNKEMLEDLTNKVVRLVKDLNKDEIKLIGLGLISYSEEIARISEEGLLQECTDMYEERNKLGKRIYSKAECADYFNIPRKKFYNYTKNYTESKDNK